MVMMMMSAVMSAMMIFGIGVVMRQAAIVGIASATTTTKETSVFWCLDAIRVGSRTHDFMMFVVKIGE